MISHSSVARRWIAAAITIGPHENTLQTPCVLQVAKVEDMKVEEHLMCSICQEINKPGHWIITAPL